MTNEPRQEKHLLHRRVARPRCSGFRCFMGGAPKTSGRHPESNTWVEQVPNVYYPSHMAAYDAACVSPEPPGWK